MKNFIPCRKCIGKYHVDGYYLVDSNGYQIAVECECHRQWRQEREIHYLADKSNIWHDDKSFSYNPLKDYKGEVSKENMKNLVTFVEHFVEEKYRKATLYLYGPNSTQKTTLSQWVGLSLIKRGFSVRYFTMQNLTRLLSDLVYNEEKRDEINELLNVDLLILDESFSKEKVTLYKSGFQLPFLETFLKERIEYNKKSTIFISNVALEEIVKNGFSESIYQMVVRNTKPFNTLLEFKDNFLNNISSVNIEALFQQRI
jgi:DNA replication protein DnaC